jgi:hypothetical protein
MDEKSRLEAETRDEIVGLRLADMVDACQGCTRMCAELTGRKDSCEREAYAIFFRANSIIVRLFHCPETCPAQYWCYSLP